MARVVEGGHRGGADLPAGARDEDAHVPGLTDAAPGYARERQGARRARPYRPRGEAMNTRTIAIIALIIAVIVLVILLT